MIAAFVKGGPGIRVFDNGLVPVAASPSSLTPTETIHHSAKAGKVDVYRAAQLGISETPSAAWKALQVGRSAVLPTPGSGGPQLRLTKIDKVKPIAGPSYIDVEPNHNVYVFVGSKPKNYRFVKFVTGRV